MLTISRIIQLNLRDDKMKKKYDPIDREIVRVMTPLKRSVSPSKIASAIGIHPTTAKKRIERLRDDKVIDCNLKGKRMKCKINKKKAMDTDFFK